MNGDGSHRRDKHMPNSDKSHKLPDLLEKKATWTRRVQMLYRERPQPVKWAIYLTVSLILTALMVYPREYLIGEKTRAWRAGPQDH